jgi:hypothetical protein
MKKMNWYWEDRETKTIVPNNGLNVISPTVLWLHYLGFTMEKDGLSFYYQRWEGFL